MMQSEREMSEKSSPEDDEKSIARKMANRACDFCHRMKMKCIGKEDPPCNRCRASGQECTFDGPRKSKASKVEDRLKFMEDQMGTLQSTLTELVKMQRAIVGPSQAQLPQQPLPQHHPRSSFTSDYNPMSNVDLYTNPGVAPGQLYRSPSTSIPATHPSPVLYEHHQQHQPPPVPVHAPPFVAPAPPGPRHIAARWDPPAENGSTAPGSDDEDEDPLNSNQLNAPFDNMLSLAEAARLKADGHMTDQPKPRSPVKRPSSHSPFDFGSPGHPNKKQRSTRQGAELELGLEMPYPVERGDKLHAFPDVVDLGYCTPEKGRQMVDLFFSEASIYMPCYDPAVDTFESLRKRSPFSITALVLVGSKIEDAGRSESELQKKCREQAEKISMNTLFSPIARVEMVQAQIILASWADTSGFRAGGHAVRMAMDMGLYRCLPYLVRTGMGADKNAEQLEEEHALVVGSRVWLTLYKMEHEMAFNLGRPIGIQGDETIKQARQLLDHPLSIRTDSRLISYCEMLSYRIPLHKPFSIAPNNDFLPDFDEKVRKLNDQVEQWTEYWDNYQKARGVPEGDLLREGLITAAAGTILYTNARILHGIRRRRDVTELSEERRHFLIKAVRAAENIVNMCLRSQTYRKNFRSGNFFTHVSAAFASRFLIRMTSLVPEVVNARQIGRDVEQLAIMLTQVPGFQFASLLRDVLSKARRNKLLPPASRPGSPSRTSHQQYHQAPTLPTWSVDTASASGPGGTGTGTGSSSTAAPSTLDTLDALDTNREFSNGFTFDQNGAGESFPGAPLDFSYAEHLLGHTTTPSLGKNGHMNGTETPMNGFMDPSLGSSMNMFIDPTYMESFFPFPPLENDTMSIHSGGSIVQRPGSAAGPASGPGPGLAPPGQSQSQSQSHSQGQGQGHQQSPQSIPMGFFGHQNHNPPQHPGQGQGQQGPPWW